jgi:hypothetical protein
MRAAQTTLEMIDQATDFEKARHLQLWLWGHIAEAVSALRVACSSAGRLRRRAPDGDALPGQRARHPSAAVEETEAVREQPMRLVAASCSYPSARSGTATFRDAAFQPTTRGSARVSGCRASPRSTRTRRLGA